MSSAESEPEVEDLVDLLGDGDEEIEARELGSARRSQSPQRRKRVRRPHEREGDGEPEATRSKRQKSVEPAAAADGSVRTALHALGDPDDADDPDQSSAPTGPFLFLLYSSTCIYIFSSRRIRNSLWFD